MIKFLKEADLLFLLKVMARNILRNPTSQSLVTILKIADPVPFITGNPFYITILRLISQIAYR